MHYTCEFCDTKIESGKNPVVHTCTPADKPVSPLKKEVIEQEVVKDEKGNNLGILNKKTEVEIPRTRKADISRRGTHESFETASNSDNELVQIKIVRKYEKGKFTVTITESTEQEITAYVNSLKEESK